MNAIHSDVVKRICEVMDELFIYNVAEMKNQIKTYVKIYHPNANPADTAFYPTDKQISAAIQRHIWKHRDKKASDQEHIAQWVAQWEKEHPDDLIFFRPRSKRMHLPKKLKVNNKSNLDSEVFYYMEAFEPVTDEELEDNFLFVYISKKQIHLWKRYGFTIFMDATYRTCKYAIPLFFLAVKTNVGYTCVGAFVVQSEDSKSIAEALKIVKTFLRRHKIKVKNIMTDSSKAEIQAIKEVFEGIYISNILYRH